MSYPPETTDTTTRPGFLVRAKSGTITETIGDAFASLPSRFRRRRRRRSNSISESSSSDPRDALSELISKITVKDIQGAKRIGSGGFGAVYVIEHPTKGKVALKQLSVSGMQGGNDLRRRALREGDTWGRLRHPNVLPFLGVLESATDLYLISPYAENGSLLDYIRLHPDVDRQGLLSEASAAAAFLHEHGIIHGDIKASNILISDDIRALLCDFGLAKSDTAVTSIGLQGVGTVRFQSPEVLMEGEGKTFASDVWALGMTIYEVLSDHVPFHQYTTSAAVITAVVVRDERPPTLPSHSTLGVSHHLLWNVANACWMKNPADRPSMKHVHRRLGVALKGHIAAVVSLAFSPDGTTVASAAGDRTIRLWDMESVSQRGEPLEGHSDWVRCLAFSPDGSTIATGSDDCTIRLWDADAASQRGSSVEGHTDWVRCVTFSPNGTAIASGSDDHSLRLWDVASGSQRGDPLEGHIDRVMCIAFSPDGTMIASGSQDRTLRLWGADFGGQIGRPLEGHPDGIRCLAFSPDGSTIATGSTDHTIRLWDVEARSQRGGILEGHSGWVSCLAFSPDGATFASGSYDKTIRLWDAETGSQKGVPLEGHMDGVRCLGFSPDGTTIASGSNDHTIRMWAIDS